MVDLGPVTCQGYWPDEGTPCLRPLNPDGTCPKAWSGAHGYRTLADELLDPRWDWCDVRTMSDPGPRWVKGACKHLDPEPVMVTDLVTGEQIVVARLCTDCDTQLETDWTALPEPNGFERWVCPPVILPELTPEQEAAFLAEYRRRAQEPPSVVEAYADPRLTGRISEGYRVNPSSKDPYEDLIFVGGGVVHRRPRPSWLARSGGAVRRAWTWYWEAWARVWDDTKSSVDLFFDTIGYMWPLYLVIISTVWKAVHG